VRHFKRDLNLAMSIIAFESELWSWTLSTWTPVLVVEEWLDLSGHFSPSLFPNLISWCSISVWETNLGPQETKLLLFSAASQGLQNCLLCWNDSASPF